MLVHVFSVHISSLNITIHQLLGKENILMTDKTQCMEAMQLYEEQKSVQIVDLPACLRTHTDTRVGYPQWYRAYPSSLHLNCLCCPTSQTLSSTHTKKHIKIVMVTLYCIRWKECWLYRKITATPKS